MANTILLKRNDIQGTKPLVSDLDFGELGYNSYDGKLYAKRIVPGSPLGEEIVTIGDPEGKVVDSFAGSILSQTGSTTIPFDDTTPLATEGTEIGSASVTTEHTTDHVSIDFSMSLESSSANKTIIISVFRGTICIGAIPITMAGNNQPSPFTWRIEDDPNIVGAVTYSGRVGIDGGSWRVNNSSLGTLGGAIEDASGFIIIVSTNGVA